MGYSFFAEFIDLGPSQTSGGKTWVVTGRLADDLPLQ